MPAYRDGKKWMIRVYYSKNGEKKQKNKRGFDTKREALEWERDFLSEVSFSIEMTFKSLYNMYMNDLDKRVKEITLKSKESKFRNHILPFFRNMKLEEITPMDIRKFQSYLLNKENNSKEGESLSHFYIKMIFSELRAIFNYASTYLGLKENPVKKSGAFKLNLKTDMTIWSLEEFERFVALLKHKPISYVGFHMLFWTGLRIGELLALTFDDLDLNKGTLNIDKTYRRDGERDIVTTTKTESSNRVITLPKRLIKTLEEYKCKIYDIKGSDRVFPVTRYMFRDDMKRYSKKANVVSIRLHDLRHSHASLLINNNVNPLAISKRLGHAKVEITLNVYAHLYPNYDKKVLDIMDSL